MSPSGDPCSWFLSQIFSVAGFVEVDDETLCDQLSEPRSQLGLCCAVTVVSNFTLTCAPPTPAHPVIIGASSSQGKRSYISDGSCGLAVYRGLFVRTFVKALWSSSPTGSRPELKRLLLTLLSVPGKDERE